MRGAAALLLAILLAVPARADDTQAPAERVALMAPAGARLATELERELSASGLTVVRLDPMVTDWTRAAPALAAARVPVGVALVDEESRVVVFSAGAAGDTRTKLQQELRVERRDRVARRRTWIAVVEHLRVRAPPAPEPAPAPPPPPAGLTLSAPLARPPATRPAPSRWTLGAAASVTTGTRAEPLGHMVLVGDYALSPRIDVGVRGLWPLLGARAEAQGQRLRWWTFGGRGTFQLRLRERAAAVQPFLGAALGVQLLLADTVVGTQTTVRWTPSTTLTALAGVRARLSPGAFLLVELEAGDAIRMGNEPVTPQHRAAAEARFAAIAAGMLFEF